MAPRAEARTETRARGRPAPARPVAPRRGLGRALFRAGAGRIVNADDTLGIRGIVVHALSEEATGLYLALGFEPSPLDPMTLMAMFGDVQAAFP